MALSLLLGLLVALSLPQAISAQDNHDSRPGEPRLSTAERQKHLRLRDTLSSSWSMKARLANSLAKSEHHEYTEGRGAADARVVALPEHHGRHLYRGGTKEIFFREEWLPIAEGWTRPATLITSAIVHPIELIILAESEWTATQACEPVVIGPGLSLFTDNSRLMEASFNFNPKFEQGLGLGQRRIEKKGPPSRVAVVEQENIETVHAPKHIQAAGALCMDRVAVLWSVPTAHRPREVKGPMPSSSALYCEGGARTRECLDLSFNFKFVVLAIAERSQNDSSKETHPDRDYLRFDDTSY
ncbi:hypothetical protein DFH08DRAFT_806881 [Mycena albidolilacea]|uniref:Uncharacterized protein n=1 Tax=Mycena albidolilacea TaxID=1033008 RepID=A0AAD7EV75_9AGAR|nr:hypothetical protein DFH08DRAFT_806881 [Mycena albidolilacea]